MYITGFAAVESGFEAIDVPPIAHHAESKLGSERDIRNKTEPFYKKRTKKEKQSPFMFLIHFKLIILYTKSGAQLGLCISNYIKYKNQRYTFIFLNLF